MVREIKSLKKTITENEQKTRAERNQYTKDTDHHIQTLLSEKIKVELQNKQLYASLKQKDELHDSLKETYEVRLKDKDNTI